MPRLCQVFGNVEHFQMRLKIGALGLEISSCLLLLLLFLRHLSSRKTTGFRFLIHQLKGGRGEIIECIAGVMAGNGLVRAMVATGASSIGESSQSCVWLGHDVAIDENCILLLLL